MFNLTDILLQAQGGQATQNLAKQFGLSTEQTQKVIEAFAPAFATGISRKAQDASAAPNVFGMMAQANRSYADAFENMAAATQPQTKDAGNQALNQ
ncbi:MAG: DUF937 domain-containing protein, partial [Hyphomicrobiaceae bacterium]|nr:DUF937 domain-containing protein [Hyphomicrobiaceae bacterium]